MPSPIRRTPGHRAGPDPQDAGAFLWALDSLAGAADRPTGTRVLYVSPLKALAVDVERNLRTPLAGLTRIAERHGLPPRRSVWGSAPVIPPPCSRPPADRPHPPDVLITTPESLFLMLTSAARETLAGCRRSSSTRFTPSPAASAVRIWLCRWKRLDELHEGRPAQRIGLSATVRPPGGAGAFLSRRLTSSLAPSGKSSTSSL